MNHFFATLPSTALKAEIWIFLLHSPFSPRPPSASSGMKPARSGDPYPSSRRRMRTRAKAHSSLPPPPFRLTERGIRIARDGRARARGVPRPDENRLGVGSFGATRWVAARCLPRRFEAVDAVFLKCLLASDFSSRRPDLAVIPKSDCEH